MPEIRSSGTFEAGCQHVNLTCDLTVGQTPTANTSVAQLSQFQCTDCGVALYPVGPKGGAVEGIAVPLVTTAPAAKSPAKPAARKSPTPPDPSKGLAGTEMLSLTAELGIVSPPGCGCKGTAATMDRLGVEGCRERISDLRLMVAGAWESWGWKDKLKAVAASAWKAAGLGVNPTDPVRDLLEIAIERADAKRTQTTEAQ